MSVQVIDITVTDHLKVKVVNQTTWVVVDTNEVVVVPENGVGFILGKRRHQVRGIYVQAGIIHPGWSGRLSPCITVLNDFECFPGQKIAHAVIISGEDLLSVDEIAQALHDRQKTSEEAHDPSGESGEAPVAVDGGPIIPIEEWGSGFGTGQPPPKLPPEKEGVGAKAF